MSEFIADHAAPPDLPAEMLTETSGALPGTGPLVGASASPPGPDLPTEMLTPARMEAPLDQESVGPDLAADLLAAPSRPESEGIPGEAPMIDSWSMPEPRIPATGAVDEIGPSLSLPLSADVVQFDEEHTFEEKWDSLARRLQSSSAVGEGAPLPVPPDLPDEMLRPTGGQDASEEMDEYKGE